MTTYPFINYKLQTLPSVISQPQRLLEMSVNPRLIDSIRVTNTTEFTSFADVYLVRQNPDTGVLQFNALSLHEYLGGFETMELITESCVYLQPGDCISVNSDSINNKLDFLISYREVLNTIVPSATNITLTQPAIINTLETAPETITATLVTGQTFPTGFTSGQKVLITGAFPNAYNGFYTATIPSGSTNIFTYQVPNSFSYGNITGTIQFVVVPG